LQLELQPTKVEQRRAGYWINKDVEIALLSY